MRKLVSALLLLLAAGFAHAADHGIVSKPSKHSVPDTVSKLESALKGKDITVFAKVDHAAQAQKAGMTMRPMQLLIFGNPKGGTPIMQAEPPAGIDLPLKALVWQDEKGQVWLSYNSPDYLKQRHELSDDLMKPIAGVGKLLESVLQ